MLWVFIAIVLALVLMLIPRAARRRGESVAPPPENAATGATLDIEPQSWEAAVPVVLPPADAEAVRAVEATLAAAAEPREIAASALQLVRSHVPRAAILSVRRGFVRGVRGAGGGLDSGSLAGLMVPLSRESVFKTVVTSGQSWVGAPPEGSTNELVLEALRKSDDGDVAVFPVKIAGRVAALVYADHGKGFFSEHQMEALRAIVERVAGAYERALLARKEGASDGRAADAQSADAQ